MSLLLLLACTSSMSPPDASVAVLSARCNDLYEDEDDYVNGVIGDTEIDVSNAVVLLTSGALWYYATDYTLTTMGETPQVNASVSVAYIGECPDDYRVFVLTSE